MKKRFHIVTVFIVALILGTNLITLSGEKELKPIVTTNYMEIMNATHVCEIVDFAINVSNASVTIYDKYNNEITSFSTTYSGIYPVFINAPAGNYKAVLTTSYGSETDYFKKICEQ
ncbi:MAG: hypothetical protein N4A72_07500 [Bacteroidales bacterium]|jgi:hypothetical protein|nr:hypothetical protein [Bacteroidales bacterium]